MVTQNVEFSVGGSGVTSGWADHPFSRAGNLVFKSGPLYISSKGIGWASWKRRWFILTRTSLVFFRRNPSIVSHKGGEVDVTLGGIDLNNSGSVVVRADKRLLTVLFPDGGDGRAFTLKAETLEDLYEWKTALEDALAQAPSVALVMGQNGIFRNEPADGIDVRDKHSVKSLVVGRPILLTLEDVNGAPSFLEKALRFLEQYGVKVEGILRQSAAVDDVACRVWEYEQGKNEFSPDEDPHIVADCIKHVLRELPSPPVPASCCSALLEACRTERGARLNAIRRAIYETFPEPNCRLLRRILLMMRAVASHQSENRMSLSAVAACMAPLILRPLVAGDCELENGFDASGDGSQQLLKAAAAANHAQAIVITLLEEYGNIFEAGSISSELSESEESGSEIEEPTNDEVLKNDDAKYQSATDAEDVSRETCSKIRGSRDDNVSDRMGSEDSNSDSGTPEIKEDFETNQRPLPASQASLLQHDCIKNSYNLQNQSDTSSEMHACMSYDSSENIPDEINLVPNLTGCGPSSCFRKSKNKLNNSLAGIKQSSRWGHIHAKKNHSLESIDYAIEDEVAIQRLEDIKTDLQNRIVEEAKGNAILQASLERRRQALHERRSALEQDVARLKKQLQRERDLREALEAGLNLPFGHLNISVATNDQTKLDLEEIALAEEDIINLTKKVEELHLQLHQQLEWNNRSLCDSCSQHSQPPYYPATLNDKQKNVEVPLTSFLSESLIQSKEISNSETVKKQAPPHLQTKQLLHKQQLGSPDHDSIKSSWVPAMPFVEPAASSHSRKFAARSEVNLQQGNISTSFALTKLTARLNFLKERRTQIAKEMQNFDKGQDQENV